MVSGIHIYQFLEPIIIIFKFQYYLVLKFFVRIVSSLLAKRISYLEFLDISLRYLIFSPFISIRNNKFWCYNSRLPRYLLVKRAMTPGLVKNRWKLLPLCLPSFTLLITILLQRSLSAPQIQVLSLQWCNHFISNIQECSTFNLWTVMQCLYIVFVWEKWCISN